MTKYNSVKWMALTVGGLVLAACGGGGGSGSPGSTSGGSSTSKAQSTVNLVVTDSPSLGITVLSFQVQITGAVLQPGSVSLLPKPVTVDLAQLVSDTGFLASTVIDSVTYTSLELSYANPQVTLLNNTGGALNLAGTSCAPGATCTFAPALDNASITIASGLFPLTLTASSTTGLNLDLSIPDLLQSDLSINFANGNAVNLSLLGSAPIRIDDILATVTSVSGSEIGVTTAFGDSLVLDETSTTAYRYPSSLCADENSTCVVTGQVLTLDASLSGHGSLAIDSLSYLGASSSSLVKALVITAATGTTPAAQLLLQRGINASAVSPGQIATVTLASDASYSIATAAYPKVTGGVFAGAQDLLPGQEVIVSVGPNVVAGSTPTFTTESVALQSSQVLGDAASAATANSILTIDGLTGLFTSQGLHTETIDVQADANTTYVGIDSLSAITAGNLLIAKGPLLNVTGSPIPVIAAVAISARN